MTLDNILISKQDTSTHPLILTANAFVLADSLVEIYIDMNANIQLPAQGVQLNLNMGLASTAQNGPLPLVPPTYFDSVAPIGSFLETSKLFM